MSDADDTHPGSARARCRLMLCLLGAAAALTLVGVHALTPFGAGWTVAAAALAGLTLAVAAIVLARRDFLIPQARTQQWALRMRGGELSARIPIDRRSSFADPAEDLNSLGEMLESLARKAEEQFLEHTRHITQKTRSLAVLYDVAASINVSRDLNDLLTRFLHTLTDIVGAEAAAVRLVDNESHIRLVASVGLSEDFMRRDRVLPSADCLCGQADGVQGILVQRGMRECEARTGCRFLEQREDFAMLVVPLQYRDKTLGVYNLYVARANVPQMEELEELLVSIGRHLGMAIEKARLDRESQYLSIMEERSTIANELHDSLAQTLVSIGYQVRILDDTLHQGDEPAAWQNLERIERMLEDANRELRTLISHFRASIDQHGLVPSIEHVVARFRSESGIQTFLQQEWPQRELPAEYEIQVLRIVQETLSNIRKHAQAHAVRVMLSGDERGNYRVLVEDDGVGIDPRPQDEAGDGEHFGLNILEDRARRLNGELRIESEPGEGTQVVLSFRYPSSDGDSQSSVRVDLSDTEYELARTGY